MKIHIVASRLHTSRILPRLARDLMMGTGWTLSEHPDPTADLNYFFPYLEYPKSGWKETRTAAWFTHRDGFRPDKAALWDSVAASVDLRTVTARPYLAGLAEHGPAALVRPAVDEAFSPKGGRPGRRVVGLNGFTYGDERKGEDLVARLAASDLGRSCRWKASGRGWPVPTKSYAWEEMPDFFRSLDVFLCASRLEGVPMPPLEALRCGVPVVVPRGVGMLDDLPGAHGVYRFQPGDYADLERALGEALADGGADPLALREAAAAYCLANWCADHELAFDGLLEPRPVEVLPGWEGNSGMYCVAFGEPSRRCAKRLVGSFKKHMPGVPVCFAGAGPLGAGEDVFVQQPDADVGGRLAKLAVDRLAPEAWRYVLYLDADTEAMEPLDFLFRVLADGWEFLICKDMHDRHWLRTMDRGDNHEECMYTNDLVGTDTVMQYNGGMFAYRRCDRTRAFFEAWNQEYQKWLGRDQGALIRALHTHPLRLFVLMNQWNASDRYALPPGPLAVMHHNTEARRWGRSIKGRIDGADAWQAVKEWEAKYG